MINKLIAVYASEGLLETIKRILFRIKNRLLLCRHVTIQYKPLSKEILQMPNESDNLSLFITEAKYIDEYYKDVWHTPVQAQEKLRKGHTLCLIKNGTANLFYGWVELMHVDLPWIGIVNLDLPATIAYLSGAYVPPEHRGKRLQKHGITLRMKYLLENTSATMAFTITAPDNIPTNKTQRSLGFRALHNITFIRVLGIKIYALKRIDKKHTRWLLGSRSTGAAIATLLISTSRG
jgi:hypothetical protein